jgi:TolA-binding protein
MTRTSPVLIALAIVFATIGVSTQSNEDLPRRQYESGLAFLKGQRYAEAMKDFQAIIDSFPRSQVADNALLQMALYQIDVAKDLSASQSAVE